MGSGAAGERVRPSTRLNASATVRNSATVPTQ